MPGRVRVVAASEDDAAAVIETLIHGGIAVDCLPITALDGTLQDPYASAVVITDEALALADLNALSRAIAMQPPWSDIPIILLAREDARVPQSVLDTLRNLIRLEWPIQRGALAGVTRAALRARECQWKARDYLAECGAAEQTIKDLTETFESRVAQRTQQLTETMAQRLIADPQRQDSENLYRTTIELSGLIPWTASSDGQIETAGEGWYRMTGATIEQTIGAGWRSFVHADDVDDAVENWLDATKTLKRYDTQYRLRQRDGSYRHCRVHGAPLITHDTDSVRWYGTLEDVHDRYVAEEQLRQVQSELIHVSRLSAMGAMAATLAHELNQPLSAIANYVRGAQRLLTMGGDDSLAAAQDALTEADAGAIRAGQVVRKLRELVARGRVKRDAGNLSTHVHEAARVALLDADALGITCTFELDETIEVLADRVQLQQVIINLLRNAVEAVQSLPVRQILVVTERIDEQTCCVAVHDSGLGIAPDFADRLFTPFATTKEHGVGIGLSISRTIVEANGGQLSTRGSRLGGAAFWFTIPLAG